VRAEARKKKIEMAGEIYLGILDKNQSNMQTKCHHRILGEKRN
jgi:hypothetical protein